jgi:hypothetical protein
MRYTDWELDDLLEAINCKEDLLALESFLFEFPEFFTPKNKQEVEEWILVAKWLF